MNVGNHADACVSRRFHATTTRLLARVARCATAAVLCASAAANAHALTKYAIEVPPVSDWENESYALGGPSYCDQTGCCAGNAYRNSEIYLQANDFDPFTIPEGQRVTSVVVGVYARYDRNTSHCNIRMRVSSGVNVIPETYSGYYVWYQGNSGECEWYDWNITNLRSSWSEYDVNHFRVAVRRFPTDTQDTVCRVNGFRIVVTTEPLPGACCLEDGTCQLLSEESCLWGDWYEGASCSPCPCDPVCAVNPGSLSFGEVQVGAYRDEAFLVYNPGCAPLSGFVAEDAEGCAHFEIVAGGGPFTLQQNQQHSVTVRYRPLDEGFHNCQIDLGNMACDGVDCDGESYEYGACCESDGGCFMSRPEDCYDTWIGNNVPCQPNPCPACQVVPEYIEFEEVMIGASADSSFVVRNIGGGTLTGVISADCEGFSIISGGGQYSLGPLQERTVVIRFTPVQPIDYECLVALGSEECDDVYCDGTGEEGGACCLLDTCLLMTEYDCYLQDGTWLPAPCEPNPCGPPSGACCIDGLCVMATESECDGEGGEWMSGDCDPNPCTVVGLSLADLGVKGVAVQFPNPYIKNAPIAIGSRAGGQAEVCVIDASGRAVRRLFSGSLPGGIRTLRWDGQTDSGDRAASGFYILRAQIDGKTVRKSFIVLRP